MLVKMLISTLVGLDSFCNDPSSAFLNADNGTLALLQHNEPTFYVLT
ncbi:hypothetical protein [Candidatus Pantoea carbekii]|nr:hypothetical protein [Candidatus Pantoea carbekii]